MTQLYSKLAGIYHEMYQHVFDYDKEFVFYDSILKQNNCKTILEIGCGSSMLANLTENQDIIITLAGIHNSLKDNGLLIFDLFEANGIFDNFNDFEQNIEHNDKKIKRISRLKKNLKTGWTYDWYAKYIIEQDGNVEVFDDITTLRAFTKDEILLFLKLTDFRLKEIVDAGKAFTIITEKIVQ